MSEKTGFYLETADFEKRFKEIVFSVSEDVAAKGLYAAGQAVMNAADDELPRTPWKRGDLRASRQVKKPVVEPDEISVRFGYNSKYAAYQHEGQRKDGSHKVKHYTKTMVTSPGPKFLEKKMAGNPQRFMAIVVGYIRRRMGKTWSLYKAEAEK